MPPSFKWIAAFFAACLTIALANPPDLRRCPVGCDCTKNAMTVCTTLDFPNFNTKILKLKITNPTKPLKFGPNYFSNLNLKLVDTIYIENAKIEEIDEMAFNDLENFVSLNFVNSTLPKLTPNTFVNAKNLEQLSFENCPLINFESIKSESLKQLQISGCRLETITNATFENLVDLETIYLQNNEIHSIDSFAFQYVLNLNELSLANNKITKLPKNIFASNLELASVDLTGNPLRKLDPSPLINLEKLVLKNCLLTEFNGGAFTELCELDLSNNSINELSSDVFGNMQNLETLDLSNNKLKSLPSNIFGNNSRLQKIVLDHNDFQALPKFANAETFSTYTFSCSHCGLELINDDTFDDMTALVILNLSNNRIKDVRAEIFNKVRGLTRLDLSYNLISNLELNVFEKNSVLNTLNLSGNQLESLDSSIFSNNNFLKSLDISNNVLTQIWKQPAMMKVKSLDRLNVANNKLDGITRQELEVTENLKVLNLNNNHIQCNNKVELANAIEWLNNHTVVPSMKDTHEEMVTDYVFISQPEPDFVWEDMMYNSCGYYDYSEKHDFDDDDEGDDDDTEDIDDYDQNVIDDKWLVVNNIPVEYGERNDIAFGGVRQSTIQIPMRDRYSFLWPILVFMFTALFVLLLVTNIILFILRRRGQLPRNINFSWKNGHGGFVYKPLTEDMAGSRLSISKHIEQSKIPIVHQA